MMLKNIFVILLVVSVLGACKKQNNEDNRILKTADSLYDKKEYEQARVFYLKALKNDSSDASLRKKLESLDSLISLRDIEEKYHNFIVIADENFDNKSYVAAKESYTNAYRIKPNDVYAQKRLKELELLLPQNEQDSNKSFHVIVGSFKVKSNAIRMQKKLITEGHESNIIPRFNGEFNAVSYTSHVSDHGARNNIEEARADVHPESWVLHHIIDTK